MNGLRLVLPSMLLAIALTGCQSASHQTVSTDQRASENAWVIHDYENQAINNAIIAQHTLYPYHFLLNSEQLTELGDRDLMVLADHFMDAPGPLNIRRGNESDELYQARIDHVKSRLVNAGIDTSRVKLADDFPGGTGQSSQHALVILGGTVTQPAYPHSQNYDKASAAPSTVSRPAGRSSSGVAPKGSSSSSAPPASY